MQQLLYTMHFKGQAATVEGSPQTMMVSAKAVSCSITTVVNKGGLTGGFNPSALADAVFESEVTLVTAGTFSEKGTIAFGDAGHRLHFASAADGWLGQSPDPALRQGAVSWTVDGGEGQFAGAGGTITSNFTVNEAGQVEDYHMGVIYLK